MHNVKKNTKAKGDLKVRFSENLFEFTRELIKYK